jgi:predicted  nucleic acid-binding Zn-ribbon protein
MQTIEELKAESKQQVQRLRELLKKRRAAVASGQSQSTLKALDDELSKVSRHSNRLQQAIEELQRKQG